MEADNIGLNCAVCIHSFLPPSFESLSHPGCFFPYRPTVGYAARLATTTKRRETNMHGYRQPAERGARHRM